MDNKIVVLLVLIMNSFSIYAMDLVQDAQVSPLYPTLNSEGEDYEMDILSLEERNEKIDTSFLPMNNLKMTVPQIYVGGKAATRERDGKKELGEEVDLTQIDPIKKVSFRELITEQHKKGMAYILAVLLIGKERHYQDATSLVQSMFDEKMRRKKNNKQNIAQPIHFFALYPEEKGFEYLMSESELRNHLKRYKPDLLYYSDCFFLVNVGIRNDGLALNKAGLFCYSRCKKSVAQEYYLKAIDLEYNYAMCNYALNCWNLGDYDNAEKYALMAKDHGVHHIALSSLLWKIENQKDYLKNAVSYLDALEKGDKDAKSKLLDMIKKLSASKYYKSD